MVFRNKKLIAFLLFLLVLIFSGCDGANLSSGSSNSDEKIHVGTEGLVMNFVENAPPNEIYVDTNDGTPFEATLEIRNKGAFPEDSGLEGRLYIGGFDKTVIQDGRWIEGTTDGTLPSNLNGKGLGFPEGGYTIMSYLADSINFPFESDNYEPTVQVTACYEYQTSASPLICIDKSPTSTSVATKACKVSDLSLSGGQGGPVAVTNIEQSGNSQKAIFKIYVQNSGNGRVISRDKVMNECLDLKFNDVDEVAAQVSIQGLGNGDCTPTGSNEQPIRLVNGKGIIVCSFDLNGAQDDAYTTPLQIRLLYGYSTTISKKVNIINLNN